jgi:hypothetical protein
MAIKLTLGTRQAESVLRALSIGIDHMQDELDDGDKSVKGDIHRSLHVFRKLKNLADDEQVRLLPTE